MAAEDSPIPRRGRVARTVPLIAMAGNTTAATLVAALRRGSDADAMRKHHEKTAKQYAEYLGRSKGMLMKAGQILSFTGLGSTLIDEHQGVYARALARLQQDVEPMPFDTAEQIVEAELGRSLPSVFAEFDRRPVGSASIGQVHRARLLDGREVAVKIQYPGVADAIRADLANTKLLATFFQMAKTAAPGLLHADMTSLATEVSARIGDEIDYRTEAEYQNEFSAAYRGHPFIRIPTVLPDFSTSRVLTQEFADGMRYEEAVEAEEQLRDQWGEAVYRFTIGSVRRFGLFNADPHPGNYRFNADGSVTFLDFGCVKRYPEHLVVAMQSVMNAAVDSDANALFAGLLESGAVETTTDLTPSDTLEWFRSGLDLLTGPQPYTFDPVSTESGVREKFSPIGPHRNVVSRLSMPPDMLMIFRVELGMYSILAGLRSTGSWETIRCEWDRDGEPATATGMLDQEFWRART
ncbi:AarF/ABC1/UbiB kinase family protein [Nocardia sp. NBC_01499]|uniref:ABC1 kinase family protein n=1 Tax=Nocardia sp. NBC_01499 TaxID=2903597 RepID=UPI003864EC41